MRLFRRNRKDRDAPSSRFAYLRELGGNDAELQEQFALAAAYLEGFERVQVDQRSASGVDLQKRLREHEAKLERSWNSVRDGESPDNVRAAVTASASELEMLWSEATDAGRQGRAPVDVLAAETG